jgi:hypothetical protein
MHNVGKMTKGYLDTSFGCPPPLRGLVSGGDDTLATFTIQDR